LNRSPEAKNHKICSKQKKHWSKIQQTTGQNNTMQSYSRLQCSPVFWVAADLPQQNNKTTNTVTQYRRGKREKN